MKGRVKSYNGTFGWIISDNQTYFFHRKNVVGSSLPVVRAKVDFDVRDSALKPGKVEAWNINVEIDLEEVRDRSENAYGVITYFDGHRKFGFISDQAGDSYYLNTAEFFSKGQNPSEGLVVLFEPSKRSKKRALKCTKLTNIGELNSLIAQLLHFEIKVLDGLTLKSGRRHKNSNPFGDYNVLYLALYQCLKPLERDERVAGLKAYFAEVLNTNHEEFIVHCLIKANLLFTETLKRDGQFVFATALQSFLGQISENQKLWDELLNNEFRQPSTIDDYVKLYFFRNSWRSNSGSEQFLADVKGFHAPSQIFLAIANSLKEHSEDVQLGVLTHVYKLSKDSPDVCELVIERLNRLTLDSRLKCWLMGLNVHLEISEIAESFQQLVLNHPTLLQQLIERELIEVLLKALLKHNEISLSNELIVMLIPHIKTNDLWMSFWSRFDTSTQIDLWLSEHTDEVDIISLVDFAIDANWMAPYTFQNLVDRIDSPEMVNAFIDNWLDKMGTVKSGSAFELVNDFCRVAAEKFGRDIIDAKQLFSKMAGKWKVKFWLSRPYLHIELIELVQYFWTTPPDQYVLISTCARLGLLDEFLELQAINCFKQGSNCFNRFVVISDILEDRRFASYRTQWLNIGKELFGDELDVELFWLGKYTTEDLNFVDDAVAVFHEREGLDELIIRLNRLDDMPKKSSLASLVLECHFLKDSFLHTTLMGGQNEVLDWAINRLTKNKDWSKSSLDTLMRLSDLNSIHIYQFCLENLIAFKISTFSKYLNQSYLQILQKDKDYFDWMLRNGHFSVSEADIRSELDVVLNSNTASLPGLFEFNLRIETLKQYRPNLKFNEIQVHAGYFGKVRGVLNDLVENCNEIDNFDLPRLTNEVFVALLVEGVIPMSLDIQKRLAVIDVTDLNEEQLIELVFMRNTCINQLLLSNLLDEYVKYPSNYESLESKLDVFSQTEVHLAVAFRMNVDLPVNDHFSFYLWQIGADIELDWELTWALISDRYIMKAFDESKFMTCFYRCNGSWRRLFKEALFDLDWDKVNYSFTDVVNFVQSVNEILHILDEAQLDETFMLEKVKDPLLRLYLCLHNTIEHFDYNEFAPFFNHLNNEERRRFRSLAEAYMRKMIKDEQQSNLIPWKIEKEWVDSDGTECYRATATWRSIHFMPGYIAFCKDKNGALSQSYPFPYANERFNYLSDYLAGRRLGVIEIQVKGDVLTSVSDLTVLEEVLFKADIEKEVNRRLKGGARSNWEVKLPVNMLIRNECIKFLNHAQLRGLEPTLITEFTRDRRGGERLLDASLLYSIPTGANEIAIVWESLELHKSKATHIFTCETYNHEAQIESLKSFLNGATNIRSTLRSKNEESEATKTNLRYFGNIRHDNHDFERWRNALVAFFPNLTVDEENV